jgi:subtilisin family serine protease
MPFLTGNFSTADERWWGIDSAFRSSLYRVELGTVSFGEFSSFDSEDWYELRLPGPGSYRVLVSNDPVNNYSIANTWFTTSGGVRIAITDRFGLEIPSIGSSTAWSFLDGQLTLTYSGAATFGDYYVRVTHQGFGSADYVLKLESALPPPDLTPPRAISFSPADGASGVAPGADIVISFSETVQRGSGTITLRQADGTVVETFSAAGSSRLTFSGTTLTVNPTSDLRFGTTYFLELPAGSVRDLAGNGFEGRSDYDFTTRAQPPTVRIEPAEGRESAAFLTFDLVLSAAQSVPVSVQVATGGGQTATPGVDFQAVSRLVTFAPGTTTATFSVPLREDTRVEPSEILLVELSNPTGATLAGDWTLGAIQDNDSPWPLPTDEYVQVQWHLYPDPGANVLGVWPEYTGRDVKVGVFDQGIDALHTELDGSTLIALGRVAATLAPGGAPILANDDHGTAVAGVIAAERDGRGVVGVAYDADLVSIYSPLIGDLRSQIVNAFTYALALDVLNDSWGFAPQFYSATPWPFRDNFRDPAWAPAGLALKRLADEGRDGLGTIVVQAAGNSFQFGDDTNLHNFQNSRYVVTVGATDYSGNSTSYSSPGASILISAPGGGGDSPLSQIWTTARPGRGEFGDDDLTAATGTSFAAPVVSGVVALMLEANPRLGWRDVQQILAYGAVKTAASGNTWEFNGARNWNGGGLHFDAVTHDLGFGLVDARASVRLAESWRTPAKTSANDVEVSVTRATPAAIPDGSSLLQQSVTVSQDILVERAEVTIDIRHTFVGDLALLLTSPTGTSSWLLWRAGANNQITFGTSQDNIDFTFTTVLSMGERSVGQWSLAVFDMAAGDVGQLRSWTLTLMGSPYGADDVYVYTDEFGESAAQQPARATLSDSGGVDVLNAAAVSSASLIDLTPGAASRIDARTLTITPGTVIESAWGGDGADTLRGNAAANELFGGRGNDALRGAGGNDTMDGGQGVDVAVFSGRRADYLFATDPAGATLSVTDRVPGRDGTDTLRGMEFIRFSDGFAATAPSTTQVQAIRLQHALYGVPASEAAHASAVQQVASSGLPALAAQESARLLSAASADLAARVSANLSIDLAPPASAAVLREALAILLDAFATARGQVVANGVTLLSALEGDSTWGASAQAFNARVRSDFHDAHAMSPVSLAGLPEPWLLAPPG